VTLFSVASIVKLCIVNNTELTSVNTGLIVIVVYFFKLLAKSSSLFLIFSLNRIVIGVNIIIQVLRVITKMITIYYFFN
jgi:hypothetical protein